MLCARRNELRPRLRAVAPASPPPSSRAPVLGARRFPPTHPMKSDKHSSAAFRSPSRGKKRFFLKINFEEKIMRRNVSVVSLPHPPAYSAKFTALRADGCGVALAGGRVAACFPRSPRRSKRLRRTIYNGELVSWCFSLSVRGHPGAALPGLRPSLSPGARSS